MISSSSASKEQGEQNHNSYSKSSSSQPDSVYSSLNLVSVPEPTFSVSGQPHGIDKNRMQLPSLHNILNTETPTAPYTSTLYHLYTSGPSVTAVSASKPNLSMNIHPAYTNAKISSAVDAIMMQPEYYQVYHPQVHYQQQFALSAPFQQQMLTKQQEQLLHIHSVCHKLLSTKSLGTIKGLSADLMKLAESYANLVSPLSARPVTSYSASAKSNDSACLSTTNTHPELEKIRDLRPSNVTSTGQPRVIKRRVRKTSFHGTDKVQRCHSCNTTDTPEWRRGPDGSRTLCNACGLHYAKLLKKHQTLDLVSAAPSKEDNSAIKMLSNAAKHSIKNLLKDSTNNGGNQESTRAQDYHKDEEVRYVSKRAMLSNPSSKAPSPVKLTPASTVTMEEVPSKTKMSLNMLLN